MYTGNVIKVIFGGIFTNTSSTYNENNNEFLCTRKDFKAALQIDGNSIINGCTSNRYMCLVIQYTIRCTLINRVASDGRCRSAALEGCVHTVFFEMAN